MTILKVTVNDEQADELRALLNNISFVMSVEQERLKIDESNVTYSKIKKVLDEAKGKDLFKDIKDPVEWQRSIRKEWERDF
jgi:Xaa-Pro aminopeptidase